MESGFLWFAGLAVVSIMALWIGFRLGRGSPSKAWLKAGMALVLLAIWVWLRWHPAVAVQAIPVTALSYLEGTAAVPMFMFLMGLACQLSSHPRQRRLAMWAMVLGVVYFLHGGIWMLQRTPGGLLAHRAVLGPTLQSEDFACVPAACASALKRIGIPATESEMAHLTRTRAGYGSTLIRAMDGLRRKLVGSGLEVVLVQPSYEELVNFPTPALTALKTDAIGRHMVVLERITDQDVRMIDPLYGSVTVSRQKFEASYCRQVLVFER